jgi:tRNA-splicing ligase RtcB (3'-phosphate/5'-hydroxy nucleic acid ligase)
LIKEDIPTGFNSYDNPLSDTNRVLEKITESQSPTKYLKDAINKKAACQLGTLGGGNHFLEVVEDETEQVWLMLHSGSRGIGNNTAEYYNKIAMTQMEKQGIVKKAKADDLNYIRIDSAEG